MPLLTDTFIIDVDNFTWICGLEDDTEDLCLHGHVTVKIGKTVMEYDGTVSATALYLLKTLTNDKIMSEYDIQMVPCCGHFLIANQDLSEVTISGCDDGLDWSTEHEGDGVRITLPSGESQWVDFYSYRYQVLRFTEKVEGYYRSCQPKKIPEDEFERNGYLAFWNEWRQRYVEATLQDAFQTGREIEFGYGNQDYFISRTQEEEWYLYCQQTEEQQKFKTAEELYNHAKFGEELLKNQLTQIQIQYIL